MKPLTLILSLRRKKILKEINHLMPLLLLNNLLMNMVLMLTAILQKHQTTTFLNYLELEKKVRLEEEKLYSSSTDCSVMLMLGAKCKRRVSAMFWPMLVMMFGWETTEVTNTAELTQRYHRRRITQNSLIIVSLNSENTTHQLRLTT